MAPWLMFILFVVISLTVLMYLQKPKMEYVSENFVDADSDWKGRTTDFADKQNTLFHDQIEKGVLVNPGLNFTPGEYNPAAKAVENVGVSSIPHKVYQYQRLGVGLLNDAIRQPDMYLSDSPEKDYGVYMVTDPLNAYSDKDNAFCASAKHPRDLPKRKGNETVACGWYFVPDFNRQSVGAIGRATAPLFPAKMPPNGEWIWDIETAIRKEDIKRCNMIKTCDLLNVDGIKGVCGFCPTENKGVPVTANGQLKYPGFTGGTCGSQVRTSPEQCRAPIRQIPKVTARNGKSCGTLGRPDVNNNIRLYTKSECDQLEGVHYPNGECLRPSGGSYSWDCRTLNGVQLKQAVSGPVGTCSPDSHGNLSRECLISLATGVGMTKQGSIVRMLYTTDRPNDEDKLAIEMLKTANITIPDAVLGAGNIDVTSAGNIYKSIMDTVKSGKTRVIQNAAKWLTIGSDSFDVCDFDDKDIGPFPTTCVQRAWRMAGCQPAGAKYPKTNNGTANVPWGTVRTNYKSAYDAMKSGDALKQTTATMDCLGIEFGIPKAFECTEQGIETLRYSWEPQDTVTVGGERFAAYIGRDVTTNGFPSFFGATSLEGASSTNKKTFKMRTRIVPTDDATDNTELFTDDGSLIVNNGKNVLDAWRDQGMTRYVANMPMISGSKNNIEVFYYNNMGTLNFDLRGQLALQGSNSFLQFPSKAPTIAFDFFRGRLDDIHGTVKSKVIGNMGFNTKEGIRGAKFGFNQYIQILTPLRFKAFRSYTCMINMDEFNSTWYPAPAIFDFSTTGDLNGPGAGGAVNPSMGLYYPNKNQFEARDITFVYRRNYWYGNGAQTRVPSNNTWVHIAVVWRNDYYGMDLYVNGNKMASGFVPDLYHDVGRAKFYAPGSDFSVGDKRYPDSIFKHNYIGGLNPVTGMGPIGTPDAWRAYQYNSKASLNGTMAWLHFYDYALTPSDIKAEMKYHMIAQPAAPAFKSDLKNEGVNI
jgi:hypothetical protein